MGMLRSCHRLRGLHGRPEGAVLGSSSCTGTKDQYFWPRFIEGLNLGLRTQATKVSVGCVGEVASWHLDAGKNTQLLNFSLRVLGDKGQLQETQFWLTVFQGCRAPRF